LATRDPFAIRSVTGPAVLFVGSLPGVWGSLERAKEEKLEKRKKRKKR
jgi:hypothetical protein